MTESKKRHLLPQGEAFGLANQMRHAAISVSSNILRIAYGSGAEPESQIEIARELYLRCNFSSAEEAINRNHEDSQHNAPEVRIFNGRQPFT